MSGPRPRRRRAGRVRAAVGDRDAWLVGGAVRDRLLGRRPRPRTSTSSSPATRAAPARALARAERAAVFQLSRVLRRLARHRARPRLAGRPRAAARRHARGRPRACATSRSTRWPSRWAAASWSTRTAARTTSPPGGCGWSRREAFAVDPLRPLRLARLAGRARLRRRPADRRGRPRGRARPGRGVRRRAGLRRAQPAAAHAAPRVRGLVLLDELGLTEVVLPELAALHGVAAERLPPPRRARPHARGARRRSSTSSATPRPAFGAELAAGDAARCSPSRWPTGSPAAARCASARCCTTPPSRATQVELPRRAHRLPRPRPRGRRHRARGPAAPAGQRAAAAPRRRADPPPPAPRLPRPPARRWTAARVHDYLVACGAVAADVTLLTVADRLATRGRKADEAIARHLELARELLAAALAERAAGPPRRRSCAATSWPRELGLAPGPPLGPAARRDRGRRPTPARSTRARRRSPTRAGRWRRGQAASAREVERDAT